MLTPLPKDFLDFYDSDAHQSGRGSSLYLSLQILRLLILRGNDPLTTSDCWYFLGYSTAPTKADKLRYSRATALQKKTIEICKALACCDMDTFETIARHAKSMELHNFHQPKFDELSNYALSNGIELRSGRDVTALLNKLQNPAHPSKPEVKSAKNELISSSNAKLIIEALKQKNTKVSSILTSKESTEVIIAKLAYELDKVTSRAP